MIERMTVRRTCRKRCESALHVYEFSRKPQQRELKGKEEKQMANGHVFCSDEDYESIEQVEADHTDAVCIEPVEGGWAVFTNARDWEIWQAQL